MEPEPSGGELFFSTQPGRDMRWEMDTLSTLEELKLLLSGYFYDENSRRFIQKENPLVKKNVERLLSIIAPYVSHHILQGVLSSGEVIEKAISCAQDVLIELISHYKDIYDMELEAVQPVTLSIFHFVHGVLTRAIGGKEREIRNIPVTKNITRVEEVGSPRKKNEEPFFGFG